MADTVAEAVAAWHAANPGAGAEWPPAKRTGDCPACGGRGSFGTVGTGSPRRWACFATRHGERTGGAGEYRDGTTGKRETTTPCWFGDALDLEAHARGMRRVDVLRADGFLTDRPLTDADKQAWRQKKQEREKREKRRREAQREDLHCTLRALSDAPALAARVETWNATVTRFFPILDGGRPTPTAQRPHGERVTLGWIGFRQALVECGELPVVPADLPEDAPGWLHEPKAWAAGWSPSTFTSNRRKGPNCEAARVLFIDIDGKRGSKHRAHAEAAELDPPRLRALLSAMLPGVAWLAHTTASSTGHGGDRGWCWRVLIPLDRPVPPAEYRAIADAVGFLSMAAGSLAMEADPRWREPDRFYYQPTRAETYFFCEEEGLPLATDVLLRLAHG